MAVQSMKRTAAKAQYLLESNALSDQDKMDYQKLLNGDMTEAVFCDSLRLLSELLKSITIQKLFC